MKKLVFAFAVVFCVFTISSCAHTPYGPSDDVTDAGFVRSVQGVVDSGEDLRFVNKVYWLPNMATPTMNPWGSFGTIVVTDKTLYFLFWNRSANAFDVLHKQPVADIVNVKHITSIYGAGDYISIEDKNKRFDLYACYAMFAAEDLIEKNRELLDCLNTVRTVK
jgi:hypothetical protein